MVQSLKCWIGKAATYLREMNIDILSCNVAAAAAAEALHCTVTAAAAELVSLSAQLMLMLCCCPNKVDKILRSINLKEFSTIGGAINCGASNHVLYVVFCRNLNPFLIDI